MAWPSNTGAGHDLCLAPMRGLTGGLYRRAFARHFRGLDRCMAPFVETVAGGKTKSSDMREMAAAVIEPLPVVPQVLGKSPEALRDTLLWLLDLGFSQCNLNAGCPWPRITRKGRGAALLNDAGVLLRLLDIGCDLLPENFSLKLRLGVATGGTLRDLMPVLNQYPLAELVIHPRTAAAGYGGGVDLDNFADCLSLSHHRVVFNGDIRTAGEWRSLHRRFPGVGHWMLGRGLLANPFLAESIRQQETGDHDRYERLAGFVVDYAATCLGELPAEKSALGRLKGMWSWMASSLNRGGEHLPDPLRSDRVHDFLARALAIINAARRRAGPPPGS